jgi:pimeloyl-ACP methyl ester carboxylesterase
MKILRLLLLVLVALVVVVYLGALGVLFFWQRDFQYDANHPITALAATKLSPDKVETVAIPTTDGAKVNGWYEAPQPGKPLIIYYKGNYGSFSEEHERYEAFVADGYGFLAIDYRGFPMTPGQITQQHVLDDALAAYDWAKAKGSPIVVWGRSLGSGPASYVASLRQPDALLLETPFLSAADVAFDRYPYMPVYWLMEDQFPVKDWIVKVKSPVYVVHGTADKTINVHHGRAVYDLVPNKYGLWIVEGADHGDLWKAGIWEKAKTFFTDAENGIGRPDTAPSASDAAAPATPAPALPAATAS